MDDKPLSYDSLKSVLKHMSANKRFEAAARSPHIQKIDKLVPLKINYLNFIPDYMIQVNDKGYKLGIIRKYHEGETPTNLKMEKERGGIDEDLDRWGFKQKSYGFTITPGDIKLGWSSAENDVERVYTDRSFVEEELQRLRKRNRTRREDIEDCETRLQAYLCRDDNIPLPYYSYIQLSSADMEDCESVDHLRYTPLEIVSYTKKLHEAMKELLKFMFGGRTDPIHVDSFEVYRTQIIRLPEDVKFNIRNLTARLDNEIDLLTPVLDESCLPINHIHINTEESPFLPLTDNEKGMTLYRPFHGEEPLSMNKVTDMPLPRVNFMYPWFLNDGSNCYVRLCTFIKEIMRKDKPVGTRFTFRFEDQMEIKIILEMIENELGREVTKDTHNGFLMIRMTEAKEISISYRRDDVCQQLPWLFVIEVLEKNN